MKRYFYFIIPIIICVVSLSFSVRTKAADIEPYNMLANNQSGIGQQYIDELRARIATNYQGYYQSTYSWINNVPDDAMIVTYGDYLWGSYQSVYKVLVPLEYSNQNSSSISCNAYTYSDNVVDSVTINFNNYIEFWIGGGNYVNTPYINGFKRYYFDSSGDYQLIYCDKPIYCNEVLVVDVTDEISIPTIGQGIGSLSSGGHSSGTSPIDQINNGVTFNGISSGGHSSGNSVTLPTTPPTFDFTSHTENLLGQIINNTNSLIGNTSLIFGALQTINNNLISGISALFNAVSALNDNIVQLAFYDQEVVDSAWEESSCKEFIDSTVEFTDTIQNTVNGYSDHFFEGAGPESLVIPIDLTVWEFSTEDYGDFAPFDQIYYMRFPFLDETKALWQPFLLGLLYFALVTNLYFDIPNILRGAVK